MSPLTDSACRIAIAWGLTTREIFFEVVAWLLFGTFTSDGISGVGLAYGHPRQLASGQGRTLAVRFHCAKCIEVENCVSFVEKS
jgi:hypothetical protein